MTKQRPARPEPTPDSGYDSYLVPRSKTPRKNAVYDLLLALGWRFDAVYTEWHTPYTQTLQGRGRLEWEPDWTEARIRPPNLGQGRISEPLIRLVWGSNGWEVDRD